MEVSQKEREEKHEIKQKVLAFALAAAMVVTAVPATNAQAASTAKLSAKKPQFILRATRQLQLKLQSLGSLLK